MKAEIKEVIEDKEEIEVEEGETEAREVEIEAVVTTEVVEEAIGIEMKISNI